MACYKEFSSYKRSKPFGKNQSNTMIYYDKEEAVFVRYADEAAKLYYAEEEKKKQE